MLHRTLYLAACLSLLATACDGSPDEPDPTDRGKVDFVVAGDGASLDPADQDACQSDDDCKKGETCTPGYCPIWCSDDDPECCVPNQCEPEEGSGKACTADDDCDKGETCEPGYCPYWCSDEDPDCCVPASCVES